MKPCPDPDNPTNHSHRLYYYLVHVPLAPQKFNVVLSQTLFHGTVTLHPLGGV